MRYVRLMGIAVLTLLSILTAATSTSVAAEGEILGAFGTELTADAAKTTAVFESTGGGITVKCPSSEGHMTFLSTTSGEFDELFLGCTASTFKCTGLTDSTSGSILVKGTFELLAFKSGFELRLAVVFTLKPVHFECLGILTEVRGSVIGVVTTAAGSQTNIVAISLSGTHGKEELTQVNGVAHHLESETGGSAFVESSQTQSLLVTSGLLETVEVMY